MHFLLFLAQKALSRNALKSDIFKCSNSLFRGYLTGENTLETVVIGKGLLELKKSTGRKRFV